MIGQNLENEDQNIDTEEVQPEISILPVQYEITSFGADYDAEGIVKRLERDDIFIPPFQRSYVWTLREASRFIESLLLGLPVPGVFLARVSESKKLLVIDGQQRLRSLQFYFNGYFDPDPESETRRVFRLVDVQDKFFGKTYQTLDEKDRIILNDSIIHATIIKQESPENELSSIYHIFERLNTSGRKLSSQQIRVAIYHGDFIDLLHRLNNNQNWRAIYGVKSKMLKDQEMILRFLAMHYELAKYHRPMADFLNEFCESSTKRDSTILNRYEKLFEDTIGLIYRSLGDKAFRLERAFNAAVFDSTMVGMAALVEKGYPPSEGIIREKYLELIKDEEFQISVSQSTSDEKRVHLRIEKAIQKFSES